MRVESHPERGVCVLAFAAKRRQCVSPRRRQWTFWPGGFPELHCTRNCCQQARPPALDEPRQPRPHTTRIPTIHAKSRAALVLAGPKLDALPGPNLGDSPDAGVEEITAGMGHPLPVKARRVRRRHTHAGSNKADLTFGTPRRSKQNGDISLPRRRRFVFQNSRNGGARDKMSVRLTSVPRPT